VETLGSAMPCLALPWAKEHVQFALAKIGVERAARDTEGITGCGYPVKPQMR